MSNAKIQDTVEAWESGALGRDEDFVQAVEIDELAIDDAIELKSISIRMPKNLLDDLKDIARITGLGYQPLMKQVLARFVESEKKRLLREAAAEAYKRANEELNEPEPPQVACG